MAQIVMMMTINNIISRDIEFIRSKNLPNGDNHHPHKFHNDEDDHHSVNIIIMMNIKVNIIPVIGKSDCCTKKEIGQFKAKILR